MANSIGRIHVLNVDDDPDFASLTAEFLERVDEQFRVDIATDPIKGFERLSEERFDCVVSDYDMPAQNGIEFLRRVRKRHPELPFILFTGKGSEEVASEAITAGVTDYLQKETGREQYAILANKIRNTVERTRARQEREYYRERMELALKHTNTVVFEVNLDTGYVSRLGDFEQFFDVTSEDVPTWMDHRDKVVHEEDREEFDRFYRELADGERESGTIEYRTGSDAGERRWIRDIIAVNDEQPGRALGLAQEITETKRDHPGGVGELEVFKRSIEMIGVGVLVYGEDGQIECVNPTFGEMLGTDESTLRGLDVWSLDSQLDRKSFEKRWDSLDHGESRVDESVITFGERELPVRIVTIRGSLSGTTYNVGTVQKITRHGEHVQHLPELHRATRAMVRSDDPHEVCRIAVETAETTLAFPLMGIWLVDEEGDRLELIAASEASLRLIGEHPVYREGNSLSWEAFKEGDHIYVQDASEFPDVYDPDTVIASELTVPLGRHGVLNIGARQTNAFSDEDLSLAKLLAANIQVALERIDHIRILERQTDQMEFFNTILRHDVLNAVTVIKSRAQFLAEDLEDDKLRDAETIIRWSDDVSEIIQRVRLVLDTLTGEGDPQLEPVELIGELRNELDRIRSSYPDITIEDNTPEQVLVTANSLLGDVIGNILTNAIEHNERDGLHIQVDVEKSDEQVTVRIADNGTGVDEDLREAIFRRDETGHAKETGSGYGLFFVDVMVAEYGGDVWVESNEKGGATFVIELPAIDET